MYTSHTDSNEADLQSATGGRNGSAAALAHDQILPNLPLPKFSWSAIRERLSSRIAGLDLAPDLGSEIGSKRWFRGLGTFLGLNALTLPLTLSTALMYLSTDAPVKGSTTVNFCLLATNIFF